MICSLCFDIQLGEEFLICSLCVDKKFRSERKDAAVGEGNPNQSFVIIACRRTIQFFSTCTLNNPISCRTAGRFL